MNRLDLKTRTRVLALLVEGNSLRATSRIADVSYNTVCKLFADAGRVCAEYQDKALRDLPCKRLQLDEIWSFVYAKKKNVASAKSAPENAGDVWTWVAIDADTKLVPSWHVGDRSSETAFAFVSDLASRLRNRVQITTDGHKAYLEAMEGVFGGDVDYAMLIKVFGDVPEKGPRKYSPAECTGVFGRRIEGNPDARHVSTSFVERQNLFVRRVKRRMLIRIVRFQQADRKPCALCCAPLHALQFLPHSQEPSGDASNGSGPHGQGLGDQRCSGSNRRAGSAYSEAWAVQEKRSIVGRDFPRAA